MSDITSGHRILVERWKGRYLREDPGRRRRTLVDPMIRILLVEDNAHLVEELQGTLEDLTHARIVATANAEADACAWMDSRTNGCDVAIIDMFLRAGSGLGVLAHMRGYERPPRRVVLTNYATPEMRNRCRVLGADAVFDKSTEFEELVEWLITTRVRQSRTR